MVGLALLSGCTDRSVATTEPAATPQASQSTAGFEAEYQLLARGLALSLESPQIRKQFLEDLRDSPFSKHSLHFKSYVRGERGAALLAALSRSLRVSRREVSELIQRLPESELIMPVALHRARWSGGDTIVVVGASVPLGSVDRLAAALPGFRPNGESVSVPTHSSVPYAVLGIFPTQATFGPDPEATRLAAPRHPRQTVSTREQEFTPNYVDPCQTDPYLCNPNCRPEYGPACNYSGTSGLLLPSGFTYNTCLSTVGDADADGIRDQCEYELAYAFRPYLAINRADDNLGREPYWSVTYANYQLDGYGQFRIFYALSYYEDGGTPIGNMEAHLGDSEFIIVQVGEYNGRWDLYGAKLSAHWGSFTDHTQDVGFGYLTYPDGTYRGRPLVWVAEDKHANYKSQSECESGGAWFDTCNQNYLWLDSEAHTVEVLPNANLGNLTQGIPLVDAVPSRRGRPDAEYYWRPGYRFIGWNFPTNGAATSTPYYDQLWAYRF
ncbi:MAG TPA: hypothetical protein VHG28_13470 [Longimicrobiaceae bacterium]|nr:hypothetical protein [Longimicrobiaceae bacterium]